jgi:hypothetical protein
MPLKAAQNISPPPQSYLFIEVMQQGRSQHRDLESQFRLLVELILAATDGWLLLMECDQVSQARGETTSPSLPIGNVE